ncbi:MAG: hypothetical protein K5910_00845 [Bacteroidales bacterium]|nr:hypothetical protein [Bacteroidales bacterium]
MTLHHGDILTGTGGTNTHVTIDPGATVTLWNATIPGREDESETEWAGITCTGDAQIILADGSTNSVEGYDSDFPGIFVPYGYTLTICGSGTIIAKGGGAGGAGIGGGLLKDCGEITISGGTVKATGGTDGGAGIGGGREGSCGNITISGGTVNAKGGGAGIGSGSNGNCGNITISGGEVNATGGNKAAGIGGGYKAACGNITISGGEVNATGGSKAAGIGSGESGSFSSISIGSGITSVTATRGANTQAPIGKGVDDENSGDVSIDGTTSWTAGTATKNLNFTVSTTTNTDDTWTLTPKPTS